MSTQSKAKGSYEKWTDKESNELLQLLVDATNRGCRSQDGSFSKSVLMTSIIPTLNAKCKGNKTHEHVRSKLKVWKRTFKIIADLMTYNSGFVWDPETKKITAPEEVWEDYFQAHPNARHYRSEKFENFEELKIVLGNSFAVVPISCDVSSGGLETREDNFDVERENIVNESEAEELVPPTPSDLVMVSQPTTCSQSTRTGTQRKRAAEATTTARSRPRRGDDIGERVAASLERIADHMDNMLVSSSKVIEWWKAIEEITDLDKVTQMRAAILLKTPEAKMFFVRLTPDERKTWILAELERGSI